MEIVKDITQEWQDAQQFEKSWWLSIGDEGILAEKRKGDVVAGLLDIANGVGGMILDIGSGPTSMLLSYAKNPSMCVALDPIEYDHYEDVYKKRGISRIIQPAEHLPDIDTQAYAFDEVWIYNCLQHVMDPYAILMKACTYGKRLRIFEWVDIPTYTGHLHTLNAVDMHRFIEEQGMVNRLLVRGNYDNAETCMHGPFFAGIYDRSGV